jgi:hypothetical protein
MESSGDTSPQTPSDEEEHVEFVGVQMMEMPGRGLAPYVLPQRRHPSRSHFHTSNPRPRSLETTDIQTAPTVRGGPQTPPIPSLSSPQAQQSRQRYTARSAGSWREPSMPSRLKLERGLIMWLPKKELIPPESNIHRHPDFRAGEEWAFGHPSLIWSDPNDESSTVECLKVTSFRQYQNARDTTKTAAAQKWDGEGAGVLARRKLYLPIWDGKENTKREHRDLDMPILFLKGGREWMSYVNIERTFKIERKYLEPYPDGGYILEEESLIDIELYRKEYLASEVFLESEELNSKRQRIKEMPWRYSL